ncbi:MAG: DNA mismatch repair protein MutT [Veillonella sp.]|nr:DNA mismatch repair protein MutT [Veillonella sp.]
MKPTTLVFPIDEQNRILLGRKKRGFGADKYNGFGGKLAAFDFQFPFDESLTHVSYVYFLRAFTGDVEETDEMEPHWLEPNQIPYEHMWDGDRRWLPMLLEGKKLKGPIVFGRDNNMVDKMDLTTVDTVLESEHLARIDLYING